MTKKPIIKSYPEVEKVFKKYPAKARKKINYLRKLIIEVAEQTEEISKLEETLKWGEPSYLTKQGSTIRIDWKSKNPDQYAIYFKCTSKLVPTFKEVYGDTFIYEGTRAIIFKMDDEIPETELKNCIKAALTYHKVKHLKSLGMDNISVS
jgi:hypothetical protein